SNWAWSSAQVFLWALACSWRYRSNNSPSVSSLRAFHRASRGSVPCATSADALEASLRAYSGVDLGKLAQLQADHAAVAADDPVPGLRPAGPDADGQSGRLRVVGPRLRRLAARLRRGRQRLDGPLGPPRVRRPPPEPEVLRTRVAGPHRHPRPEPSPPLHATFVQRRASNPVNHSVQE